MVVLGFGPKSIWPQKAIYFPLYYVAFVMKCNSALCHTDAFLEGVLWHFIMTFKYHEKEDIKN